MSISLLSIIVEVILYMLLLMVILIGAFGWALPRQAGVGLSCQQSWHRAPPSG